MRLRYEAFVSVLALPHDCSNKFFVVCVCDTVKISNFTSNWSQLHNCKRATLQQNTEKKVFDVHVCNAQMCI